jgi:regulator of replication initiation timing
MPDKNDLAEARLALAGANMAGMALVRENERLQAENEHLASTLADYEQILAQGRAENERLRELLRKSQWDEAYAAGMTAGHKLRAAHDEGSRGRDAECRQENERLRRALVQIENWMALGYADIDEAEQIRDHITQACLLALPAPRV